MSDSALTRDPTQGDARASRWILASACASFLCFLWLYVPRINNFVLSDREFTGWVGPVAERIAEGSRPYIDFVLPIPPGSMLLLAFVQRVTGKALLLQELWVAALCHLTMGLLAYSVAAKLSSRKVALLVFLTSLVLVVQTPKECLYDHTSQVCAWASIAAGTHGFFTRASRRRTVSWLLAGFFAVAALAFKQSTAVGIVTGWVLAFGYRFAVSLRADSRGLQPWYRDAAHAAAGGAAGLVFVLSIILLSGTTPGAFAQAVFGDGPELKGGVTALLKNVANFIVRQDATGTALVPTAVMVAVAVRLGRVRKTFHVGDEPEPRRSLNRRTALAIGAAGVSLFAIASGLLAFEVRALQRTFYTIADFFRLLPAFGFVFAAAFFFAHLGDPPAAQGGEESVLQGRRENGHAYNALLIAAVTSSMIYNTSFVQFSPFYYNNPDIPLAVTCFYVALDRAKVPHLMVALFVLSQLPTFGVKLNRALSADTPVTTGHWAGARVNYRGREILRAARRVQKLAKPNETVLVLPEDVQLVGLFDRPRPPVRGAILFVDQYPRRLLDDDIRALDANLPKVIVIHPRRRSDWMALYGIWNPRSAGREMVDHVLDEVLPKHYRLDSSYRTIFFWDQGQLDVWVRKSGSEKEDHAAG